MGGWGGVGRGDVRAGGTKVEDNTRMSKEPPSLD